MLEIDNLHCKIDGKSILKGINLTLDKRQILGLTGSNGSGKSTLLRIISGLIEKDRGEIHFENFNSQNVALISSNERSFYWRLTTYQNLIFFGSIYNLSKKEIDFRSRMYALIFEELR